MIDAGFSQELLLTLWQYNASANQKLCGILAKLPQETLETTTTPSRENLWRLVNHIFLTEQHFLKICIEGTAPRPVRFAHFSDLAAAWEWINNEGIQYLEQESLAKLGEVIPVTIGMHTFRFARWELLLQCVTHSIQHRGELSIVLSGLGHPLPNMDLIVTMAEQHGYVWPWAD